MGKHFASPPQVACWTSICPAATEAKVVQDNISCSHMSRSQSGTRPGGQHSAGVATVSWEHAFVPGKLHPPAP